MVRFSLLCLVVFASCGPLEPEDFEPDAGAVEQSREANASGLPNRIAGSWAVDKCVEECRNAPGGVGAVTICWPGARCVCAPNLPDGGFSCE